MPHRGYLIFLHKLHADEHHTDYKRDRFVLRQHRPLDGSIIMANGKVFLQGTRDRLAETM